MTPEESRAVLRRIALQEGGLVEVCAKNTSYDDWRSAVVALDSAGYRMSLRPTQGGSKIAISPEMFSDGEDVSYTLTVIVGKQHWTTQFYTTSLLDFQGDPADVTTPTHLDEVAQFMTVLAEATNRKVVFIPESLDVEGVKSYFEVHPSREAH